MKNSIVVVFSSHLSEEENSEFIKEIGGGIGVKHKIVCYQNHNEYSLSEIYNKALREHADPNSIFLMCHNDIIIKTKDWGKVLLRHFNGSDFGILGVAGSTFVPESGIWWEDRSKMYGTVEHCNEIDVWASEFSSEIRGIKDVAIIDGVFIAIDPEKIVCGFNENFGKFHFYDLSFALDNYYENVNIGVIGNIRILHKSIGQVNESWEENRVKFTESYCLPIRHVSENKLRVLICCQFFKNYTGSEVSNYELSKELMKLGCDVSIVSVVVGEPLVSKANKNGVKVYSFNNLPNYVLNDEGKFRFTKNEAEFDIIHINHKPIGDVILQLYPNTPAVMHIRSEVIPNFEVPIINPAIKKYISIRESITEYIESFGIDSSMIVTIDNPFDTTRFNTRYKHIKNEREVILFVGTIDHLRVNIIEDLINTTQQNGQLLWIIGSDNSGLNLGNRYEENEHVKYLGVKANVEDYIKKCDYTAGIFKGRTTIEGFLCGKPGWIYTVDKDGVILTKELYQVPEDINKYDSKFSAKLVLDLYGSILYEP